MTSLSLREVTERWSALESGLTVKEGRMNTQERLEKARFLAMQSIQFQELVQAWEDVLRAQDDMDKERAKGGLGLPPEAHVPDPPDAPLPAELQQPKGPDAV